MFHNSRICFRAYSRCSISSVRGNLLYNNQGLAENSVLQQLELAKTMLGNVEIKIEQVDNQFEFESIKDHIRDLKQQLKNMDYIISK